MATMPEAFARSFLRLGGAAVKAAFDLALPPQCPITGEIMPAKGTLSPAAWKKLNFITPPCCRACGQPFAYDPGGAALCGPCSGNPAAWDSVRAPLIYDPVSAKLVLRLKYLDQTDCVALCAAWMGQAAKAALDRCDVIIPVPLHRWRLARRRFNQSAILAQALARSCNRPWTPDLLQRHRPTVQQQGLDRTARRRNVRGAFSVTPGREPDLRGKVVVLVDDVFTTGATANACALALKRAGAAEVHVAVIARVVATEASPISM